MILNQVFKQIKATGLLLVLLLFTTKVASKDTTTIRHILDARFNYGFNVSGLLILYRTTGIHNLFLQKTTPRIYFETKLFPKLNVGIAYEMSTEYELKAYFGSSMRRSRLTSTYLTVPISGKKRRYLANIIGFAGYAKFYHGWDTNRVVTQEIHHFITPGIGLNLYFPFKINQSSKNNLAVNITLRKPILSKTNRQYYDNFTGQVGLSFFLK